MNLQRGLNFDAPNVTGPTGAPRTVRPWKRVRNVSKAQVTALRDNGSLADREQAVMDALAAFYNRHQDWPTAPELTRWMVEHGQLGREDYNLVRPRLTELCVGRRDWDHDAQQFRLVGGGRIVTLPRRICRVTGGNAHPWKLPQVGE